LHISQCTHFVFSFSLQTRKECCSDILSSTADTAIADAGGGFSKIIAAAIGIVLVFTAIITFVLRRRRAAKREVAM
jgi:hypothetical protein